jgi:2,3-bisphosphoglycerate-independent phosphoglycerate mutase
MINELRPHPHRSAPRGPVVCVVLDGVGLGKGDEGDAVALAHTPTLDWLSTLPSYRPLKAHGTAVGLPSDGDMGNSEVGHNALGAGRVFDQGAMLVNRSIESGALFEGEVWRKAVQVVRRSGEPLHFMGLLSDGNVHSHIDHLEAMLRKAAQQGVQKLRLHVLLDGRDVPGRSALRYIDRIEQVLGELRASGVDAHIASGGGRMKITMDRYGAEWAMVERGWNVHVRGQAREFSSAREAVETMYEQGAPDDQHLDGFVIVQDGQPVGPICDGAAVVFFNFRGDRAVEISKAFEDDTFPYFDRSPRPDVFFAGMMQYDGDELVPKHFLVEPPAIDRTMGELLARAGRRQLAVAETQKFGHVTYFWNGNRSGKFDAELETYIEIPSDLLPFDERPWMKAAEVTDAVVTALSEQHFDFVRINYANGDMVGHTGNLRAARVAVEAVDLCLARLVAHIERSRGMLVVTADHGNADHMFDPDEAGVQKPRTSHSLNPVPFVIYDPASERLGPPVSDLPSGGLGHVAGTCLELLGFEVPEDYLPSLLVPRSR